MNWVSLADEPHSHFKDQLIPEAISWLRGFFVMEMRDSGTELLAESIAERVFEKLQSAPAPKRVAQKYYSVEDVSIILDVPVKTIRQWVWQKKLPVQKFGRLVRVHKDDLAAFCQFGGGKK